MAMTLAMATAMVRGVAIAVAAAVAVAGRETCNRCKQEVLNSVLDSLWNPNDRCPLNGVHYLFVCVLLLKK